jgi:zinc transport system ATP-binding protein
MNGPAPVIEVNDLSFRYGGPHWVLEDVSLTIDELDFVSIIGPNGGGKTTLVKLLLGLITPSRGRIRVLGTTPKHARPRVGYLPQHATIDPLFPIRVLDVVLMGGVGRGSRLGRGSRIDRAAASAILEQVGLAGFERRPLAELSGGQRQRVLLARALAADPELLLLDEPSAGLDIKVEHDFFQLLGELNRSTTVVLVSHDLGFVSSFVKSVVCVHRTVDFHPTSELDGGAIHDLYGGEVRLVHHEHSLGDH